MAQKPKKKRKLPKDIAERPDHEIMEKVFGKRAMKKIDEFLEESDVPPKDRENKGD